MMTMRINQSPEPWESSLSAEARADLAYLRDQPQVPREEDPNDWLSQILAHLRHTPRERLDQWEGFSHSVLQYSFRRRGYPPVGFSPRRVLRTLTEHHVAFVMVGMGAGFLQGAPYPTYNTDITPMPGPSNLEKADRALRFLDAQPLQVDERGTVDRPNRPGFTRLQTSAGMVNVVSSLPGVGGYDRIMGKAEEMDLGEGLWVWVADLEDVIRSKQTLGRSLDGVHVLMCQETIRWKTLNRKQIVPDVRYAGTGLLERARQGSRQPADLL